MLGALITLVFSVGAAGFGHILLRRWVIDLDPAARWGISGLVGLGAIGTLTLFIGLIPGGLGWGIGIVVLLATGGVVELGKCISRKEVRAKVPRDSRFSAVAFAVVAFLFSLAGVLAPSDTVDWDTLAYHLAVPKLWLAAGQSHYISFIHHSNFPFTVDNLYIWGLTWGGQSGAKAFSLAFFVFGLGAIFGITRPRYGDKASYWAATAFASTPLVIWLSGTAYIDVANGLYGGLGIAMAAVWLAEKNKSYAVLGGVLIGLCAGSKYTGLQILISTGATLLLLGALQKQLKGSFKAALLIGGIAAAIGCPWYIKNVVNTENPVYPFFYSIFGGKNWDAFSEKIYKEQQQTFGAGREMVTDGQPDYLQNPLRPDRIGGAILGLAYQPGRYIDPQPTRNGGFFFGALGFVAISAALFWMFTGGLGPFEKAILVTLGIALLMWFVLSEQSRYILGLTIPLCILAGGAVARLRGGIAMATGIVVQCLAALYVLKSGRLDMQLQVLMGKVTPAEYQTELVRFYEPSQWINQNVKGKIALYDEVFGYFLDIPYFWAGPGHTTEIGYEQLSSGDELAARLKKLGMTHVYIDLSTTFGSDRSAIQRWLSAAGLQGELRPFTAQEVQDAAGDIRSKFKVLLAEAVANQRLKLIQSFGSRLIFQVAD